MLGEAEENSDSQAQQQVIQSKTDPSDITRI
jgi:hypothetical protein